MLKKYIYLAGPIAGLNEQEATEWRNEVNGLLPYGIIGISPLRCEPVKEGMTYTDKGATIGTIIEIGWAIGLRKPLIVVSDDEQYMDHPLIKHNASWRLDNLSDAVEVITGLFGDYVQ